MTQNDGKSSNDSMPHTKRKKEGGGVLESSVERNYSSKKKGTGRGKTEKNPRCIPWVFLCLLLVMTRLLWRDHFLVSSVSHVVLLRSHHMGIQTPQHESMQRGNTNTTTNDEVVVRYVKQSLGSLYNPPQSLPVMDATESMPPRHECLKAIRKRHQEAFGLVLRGNYYNKKENIPNEFLLVDPAYHPNVGDHMITVAEQVFLQNAIAAGREKKNRQSKDTYQECSYIQASTYVPSCNSTLAAKIDSMTATAVTNRIAIWHGGGNWGDLWPLVHNLRTQSMEVLLQANYTILGMPQSLYFANSQLELANARALQQHVQHGGLGGSAGHKDSPATGRLVLSWREHESYDKAKQLYPFVTHQLIPDLAFQLGPYSRVPNPRALQVDILFLLRSDHESIYASQRNRKSITSILSTLLPDDGRGYSFSIVDWPDRLDRFVDGDDEQEDHKEEEKKKSNHGDESTQQKNFLFTSSAVRLLNLGRVVVCDRLHASILAYLGGLSFVYLDQVSGKIAKTMRVAMESHSACQEDQWRREKSRPTEPWWASAKNLTEGIHVAVQMIQTMDGGTRRRRRRTRHQSQV